MSKTVHVLIPLLLSVLIFLGCNNGEQDYTAEDERAFTPVEWSNSATIYEVNIRQFSEEGTFRRVTQQLPRIKELGIKIVWLMPVHPIGEVERKGTMGSYYSVKDYFGINPEFGTEEDFRELVDTAHDLGMRVILDWVANHSAWDNPLTETNPGFYATDDDGNFIIPPGTDWDDVLQLNYDNPDVHDYMISALRYWVEEFNIDGYRADVAYLVPVEFWERARRELEEIKPVFMLAEAHEPDLHPAFDMGYNWEMHHLWNAIAAGEREVSEIDEVLESVRSRFGPEVSMMNFITNHDENSWAGTEFDRLGDGVEAFAVLMATMEGMPLIYNGQETGFDRMLEFFEKDPIDWDYDSEYVSFYSTLMHLKREHPALKNYGHGGPMLRLQTTHDEAVYAFSRSSESEHVVVVLNLSDEAHTVEMESELPHGSFVSLFNTEQTTFDSLPQNFELEPWDYRVFVSTN